jgi:GNAT superfamily N-acetyltransferase
LEFTITSVNPLDYAAEIKELFTVHGVPEFPGFFDRAYADAVRAGARSWVGRDGEGRLMMHVACLPQRFRFGTLDVTGGLMVNAMVAQGYRSFFPARALMARAKEDAKARGDIDFVYTNPTDPARVVLEAVGFVRVGMLGRYVLPVGHRRWPVDRAIRVFHAGIRVVNGISLGAVAMRPAADLTAAEFEDPWGDSPRLRPYHDGARYTRLEGYPSASDRWFIFPRNGEASAPAAGLLVRGPGPSGLATLHVVQRDPRLPLGQLIPGLVEALRGTGCTRLEVLTLAESCFFAELRRAGFLSRHDFVPLLAAPLTAAGEAVVQSAREWEITQLDCDS